MVRLLGLVQLLWAMKLWYTARAGGSVELGAWCAGSCVLALLSVLS
jgi:hypothetical protein